MNVEEALSSNQELHADLKPFVFRHPVLGQTLQHPLVYEVPYIEQLNAIANQRYEHKLKAIVEAQKQRDWNRIIALYERPYRWDALHRISSQMTDEELAKEFAWVWVDSENVWQNGKVIEYLMKRLTDERLKPHLMEPFDLLYFNDAPTTLRIYRGCLKHNVDGLSWTNNRDVAIWFAKRLSHKSDEKFLVTGEVNKSDVLFYTNNRNESEVIVHSSFVNIINCSRVTY